MGYLEKGTYPFFLTFSDFYENMLFLQELTISCENETYSLIYLVTVCMFFFVCFE